MPLYEYHCSCGNHWEAHRSVDYRDMEACSDCLRKPQRVFSMNAKPVVYEYYSENLDARITGPKQKARLLKEKNLSEVG